MTGPVPLFALKPPSMVPLMGGAGYMFIGRLSGTGYSLKQFCHVVLVQAIGININRFPTKTKSKFKGENHET